MYKFISIIFVMFILVSCNNFLEISPKGVVSEDDLINADGAERLVNAAYSSLGNDHWHEPYTSLWPYGNVRSEDAYKGGLGAADQGEYHTYETFAGITPEMDKGNRIWVRLYIAIGRVNSAIDVLKSIDDTELNNKEERLSEMYFLRGHFHFILKILFKNIPYITDGLTSDEINEVGNNIGNSDLWELIAKDFIESSKNLPDLSSDVGRPNKFTSKAYLAKTRLFQAYEQDEKNDVININSEHLENVVSLVDEVIASGKYDLFEDYGFNYLWDYDNGIESIFEVQRSKDDGTPVGRLDVSNALNHPMYPGYACCSFHRPSFSLVSSFLTDGDGLPYFEKYNDGPKIESEEDFDQNQFDPRLDHTVGVPGHPYKYMLDVIYDYNTFTREPGTYGPFSAMKEVQQLDCPCLSATKAYAYPASSKNNNVLTYSDLLLWKAEALIELNRLDEALPIINMIRKRASNSVSLLQYEDGSTFANYFVDEYKPGINVDWTQENARKALRWERRLEFAMEGKRFFDLTRWGIAAETLNSYFEVEKTRVPHLDNAYFQKNRDEYLPIPDQQINLSKGVYKQNYGW